MKIVKASNLKDIETFSKSDPYAQYSLSLGGSVIKTIKTKVIDNNLNPTWDHEVLLCV